MRASQLARRGPPGGTHRTRSGSCRRARAGRLEPAPFSAMTRLAPVLVDRLSPFGRRSLHSAPCGEWIVEAQLVDGRPVLRGEIHQSLGGIRGAGAPVRSSAGAGQRNRLLEPRRREQALVAHLRDPVLPRRALFGGQDERIHVVRGHASAARTAAERSETAASATPARPACRSSAPDALRWATAACPSRDRTHTGIPVWWPAPPRRSASRRAARSAASGAAVVS